MAQRSTARAGRICVTVGTHVLGSCCLLGHVDFAFSYVFLGTHVSSRRSALKITKYCSHSTYTRTYTLGLCVQSSRDALHKQTLAAITNLQESQGAFAALCSKAPQPSQGKSCSLTIPLSFWDSHGYGSSCLLRTGIRLSTTLVATPLLGGPRSKVGSSSLFLQHNSLATQHFPTEGPPYAWIILLFSFPRLQSISPASPVSWKAAGSCFTEEFLLRKLSTLEPFPSVPTSTLV